MPRNHLALIAGGLTVTFIAGYQLAPRELLDSEVESRGFFATDTKRVLAAAVLSLKADGKLRVYQYVGVVSVDVQRSEALGLLQGRQELLVPAEVTYYLDLDGLSVGDDVTFDEKAKLVRVRLPKLELGDVAMQPERARVSNEGLLTFSDDVVQELAATNYLTAADACGGRQGQGDRGRRSLSPVAVAGDRPVRRSRGGLLPRLNHHPPFHPTEAHGAIRGLF
jgi:hypothetical protein